MMSKLRYTQFYIGVCILAVLTTLANLNIASDNLIILLALAVTFLGLPHGALDFAVAKSLNLVTSITSAVRFMTIYMAIAALSIGFWIWVPGIALVLFLCVSAFHFSADWRGSMPFLPRLGLAGALLCGPSVLYSATVVELFKQLLLTAQTASWVVQGMQLVFYVGLLIFLYFVVPLLKEKKSLNLWQSFEWLTLIVSSLIFSPLLHFGLYFCLLHSPKHLQDVGVELRVSLKRAVVISVPFVVLTIVLAAGAYRLFATSEVSADLLRWVFIGLFGLTMSHMLLIHLWHSSNAGISSGQGPS
jgi:Brp/Blh family beta-carotene 15,15'-monooxygenase